MVFNTFSFLIFSTLIYYTSAKETFPLKWGFCSVPSPKEDFDYIAFFNGLWYKQFGTGTMFYDFLGNCPTVEYSKIGKEIKSLDYIYNPMMQIYLTKYGSTSLSPKFSGGYSVFKYVLFQGFIQFEFAMYVVDTNYDDWAVVYYCKPAGLFKIEAAWVMTRIRDNYTDFQEVTNNVIAKSFLANYKFVPETNTGCGYEVPHL